MTKSATGMRGGLGRILLTAFLLLAIVPLAVVSYLAIERVQANMRQGVLDDLGLGAAATAARLGTWLDGQRHLLTPLAHAPILAEAVSGGQGGDVCRALGGLQPDVPESLSLSLLAADGQTALCSSGGSASEDALSALPLVVPVAGEDGQAAAYLVGQPHREALSVVLDADRLRGDERIVLVDGAGTLLLSLPSASSLQPGGSVSSEGTQAATRGEAGAGFYDNEEGSPVVGGYAPILGWQVALLVERPREAVLAREDDLAAMLIGSTLAVALLTTVLAAVVTRQITHPLRRLTMSAVKIASGDLDQHVEVDRRDEIGTLAKAFNIMTAELRSVYNGLEQKVIERTSQLTEANRRLQYQAMQLQLSAEVGRVATSILDLDDLLASVSGLVLDSYDLVYGVRYAAILLQDEVGEWIELQASSGRYPDRPITRVAVGAKELVGQTAADGVLRTQNLDGGGAEVVVPLRIGPRVIGALDLCFSQRDLLGADAIEALQSLADQVSVAIENARIYAAEREAVRRLSRLDHLRLASLGVGSRELATELNTIIGFSRLLLKGVDGSLSDLQRTDLVAIYKSGYRLSGLIDNVVTLSELEGGTVAISREPIDLERLLGEVLTVAERYLVDVGIDWQRDTGLPLIDGDRTLLRQAFLGLVTAVSEQASSSKLAIRTRVSREDASTVVIAIEGGNGEEAQAGPSHGLVAGQGREVEEMSVGLALARRTIALHRGDVRVWFEADRGLRTAVVLPAGRGDERDAID